MPIHQNSRNIVKVFPVHKIVPAGVQQAADGMRVVVRGILDENAPEDLSVSLFLERARHTSLPLTSYLIPCQNSMLCRPARGITPARAAARS